MSFHRWWSSPALLALAPLLLINTGAAAGADGGATVTVIVPADAEIFFDGAPTAQKGTERVFATPSLQAGKVFHYDIVARWKEGGKPVEQKREVDVTEGAKVRVVFAKTSTDEKGGTTEPKPDPAVEDKEVVSSKSAPRPPAATVNFRKELNLPFATLGTLGGRIDAARRTHDPIALANTACELDVAEKVSKKKASITSSALMNEAAELASLRRQEAELQATLRMSNQIETAQANIATMQQNLALAQQQAKADAESYQQAQEPTWTPRKVVVNNYTTQYMDVYVNGTFKVTVLPGQTQMFMIEHRWNPTVLTSYGDSDNGYPWKRIINGRFTKYVWNLN